MAYEWQGQVIEGEQGDQGDKGEKGPMGMATKQPTLRINSVPIKTGKIYFYNDMNSTDIVSTGTISVISNEGFTTSAPLSKMIMLSISLPACEAPTEENKGAETPFYGYVDRNIDLSGIDITNLYRISDNGDGACIFNVVPQSEKGEYGDYRILAFKLNQNQSHFSTFLNQAHFSPVLG